MMSFKDICQFIAVGLLVTFLVCLVLAAVGGAWYACVNITSSAWHAGKQ